MRIAVISDIHGNNVALEAVLADLKRHPVDQMVCLGDAIQGGPQPAEVVQRLRELACPVVMGNADAFLLTGEETGHENISPQRRIKLNEVREWSLGRLSPEDRAYIAGFQPTVTVPLPSGKNLLCYHGSPTSFDDWILPHTPEEEFRRFLSPFADNIMTGGHMHVQFIRHLGETFHFNPGSVGVAYRHGQTESSFRLDPWAEYAVLSADGASLSLEFRRVPFDTEELFNIYRQTAQPYASDSIARYAPR